MVFLIVALILCCLWKVKISKGFNFEYLSQDVSNSIKGIFAIIILFSHIRGYITLSPNNIFDTSFNTIISYIGQLMVAIFLFYSGYGINESYKKKKNYFDTFFKRRILKTWSHFVLAVLLFFIASFFTPESYSLKQYMLCWTGWESIGNSNWFVFDILAIYLLVYFSAFILKLIGKENNNSLLCILTTIFAIFLWGILFYFKRSSWWIDTIMCFPLGMWYSYFKFNIEKNISSEKKHNILIICVISLFITWYILCGIDILGVCSCLFCIVLIAILTKVSINNSILRWLGKNSFSIYILQRLPMMFLFYYGGSLKEEPLIFSLITIPIVLVLSGLFTRMTNIIDKKIFN